MLRFPELCKLTRIFGIETKQKTEKRILLDVVDGARLESLTITDLIFHEKVFHAG